MSREAAVDGKGVGGLATARAERWVGSIVRWWWFRLPLGTARYFPVFGSALSDGLYLARWPVVAAAATPLVVLIGLLLGARHPGETFTYSIGVMALLIGAGLFSAQLGVAAVVGYAIGDLLYHGHPSLWVAVQRSAVQTLLRVHLPLLISYAVLAVVCVNVPLIGASVRLQVRSVRLLRTLPWVGRILEGVVYVALIGVLVYAWANAAPVLIRPVYTWQGGQPPVAAIRPLQTQGQLLAVTAAAVAAARVVLEELALHPRVVALALPLSIALPLAVRRRPRTAGVLATLAGAFGLTLLLAGLIGSLTEGALVLLFFVLLLWARDRIRASPWPPLRLIGTVPELFRLALGFALGYFLSARLVAPQWNTTQTFRPVLLAACCSLAVMTLLMAPAPARRPAAPDGAGPGEG